MVGLVSVVISFLSELSLAFANPEVLQVLQSDTMKTNSRK